MIKPTRVPVFIGAVEVGTLEVRTGLHTILAGELKITTDLTREQLAKTTIRLTIQSETLTEDSVPR
jgi:hypothetical protein